MTKRTVLGAVIVSIGLVAAIGGTVGIITYMLLLFFEGM